MKRGQGSLELYCCFCLGYLDVEEPMAELGVTLAYEAVRY